MGKKRVNQEGGKPRMQGTTDPIQKSRERELRALGGSPQGKRDLIEYLMLLGVWKKDLKYGKGTQ